MPNFKLFFNNQANTLDVVLHGASPGMDSPLIIKVVDACRKVGHSVVAFNFPYFDRGEDHSSGPELQEEIGALKEVLAFSKTEKYSHVRLIGKSLGGIVTSFFLKSLPVQETARYSAIILGYVLGDIDLKSYQGKITVIQGEHDRFGNIDAVKKDLETAVSKNITYLSVPGADHSYRDPNTKEPVFEDAAVSLIPTQP